MELGEKIEVVLQTSWQAGGKEYSFGYLHLDTGTPRHMKHTLPNVIRKNLKKRNEWKMYQGKL